MKWSSCNAENESPQVLLGFEAHFCLQQFLISRDGALCKQNVRHAERLQRAAKDTVSSLPLPRALQSSGQRRLPLLPTLLPPKSLQRASSDPCRQHLRSHPAASCTACCSVRCPPLEQGDLPPDTSRAAWLVNLGTLFPFPNAEEYPQIIRTLKREECWKRHR